MRRHWLLLGCALVLLLGRSLPVTGAEPPRIAVALIPLDQLSSTNRALVRPVAEHYTLRRQFPEQQIAARVAPLEYLLDHLVACSVLAEHLRLIRYRATTVERDGAFADNREGAHGFIWPVLAQPGKRVWYVTGTQQGPLFAARGRGVLILDFRPVRPDAIAYTGTVFVKVDNTVLAVLTQLFAVFLKGTVDRNFEQVMRHPLLLSQQALREPQTLLSAIRAMPDADRQLLAPFAALLTREDG